ncbi:hypothetical protein ACFV08_11695 [Streptomyces fradiae]|uniref:hypothetical protein n=1 Tax=Streptomyces fradiae TaxID=1906 RepID=UPI0036B9DA15
MSEYVDRHPEGAALAAAHVDRRLEQGPAVRTALFPLVTDLLRGRPAEVRAALAPVLGAPGTPVSRDTRAALLDVLLRLERDEAPHPAVPEALLRAAAHGAADRPEGRTRALVLRAGALLARTPGGTAALDRCLADLGAEVPAFAGLLRAWAAARQAGPVGALTGGDAGRFAGDGTEGGGTGSGAAEGRAGDDAGCGAGAAARAGDRGDR